MRIINNPDAIKKSAMEGELNRLAISLIGYLFITSMISLIVIFITGADINGIVYVISSLVGFAFISFMYRKDFEFMDLLEATREIPPRVLLNSFVVLVGIEFVFRLIAKGVQGLFMGFNYQLNLTTAAADAHGSLFIMFNFVILVPIIEGLVFRGLLLRALAQYGRNFAIIVSSILFGLYHAALIDNGYYFVCGILLAYITLRYSLKWAIALNCVNNLLMLVLSFFNIPDLITWLIFGVFFVLGVVILFIKRKKIKKYFDKGRSKKNAYKYTFTNTYILGYVALTVILTILEIDISSIYG